MTAVSRISSRPKGAARNAFFMLYLLKAKLADEEQLVDAVLDLDDTDRQNWCNTVSIFYKGDEQVQNIVELCR